MRFLFTTLGTAGDVHPFIAVGLALKRRGHDVVIMANPRFADRILRVGLGHWPLGDERTYDSFVTDPALIRARSGPSFVLHNLLLPAVEPMAAAMRQAHAILNYEAVFAHHICFAAPRVAAEIGVPCISAVLAPLFWLSRHERTLVPGLPHRLPDWLDRPTRSIARRAARLVFDPAINRSLRSIRAPLGRDFVLHEARGEHSPRRLSRATANLTGSRAVLGLWSPHVRPALPDDPVEGHICGYTWFDRGGPDLSPPDQQALRTFLADGPPPVVVTLGTSVVHHGEDLYALAADACRSLDRRIVLLGARGPTGRESPHLFRAPYAPLSRVLPSGACTIHHGGAGTTAQAFRAGTPSIIIPFANDEFDNAARAQRLGVGIALPLNRLTARSLAQVIDRAAADHALRGSAALLGHKLVTEDGAEAAADHLERTAALGRVVRSRASDPRAS